MRVGVWMPTAMPYRLERSFFLDWVRLADEAGFDTLGTVDVPTTTCGIRWPRSPLLPR
jgi:hypothetical protein